MEGAGAARQHHAWFQKLLRPQAGPRPPGKPFISLPTVCPALGAPVLALVIWPVDVVRPGPQAPPFYQNVRVQAEKRRVAFNDRKNPPHNIGGEPAPGNP